MPNISLLLSPHVVQFSASPMLLYLCTEEIRSTSYDFTSTRFDLSMQFDELAKPIEEMTLQGVCGSAWQKLNKMLKYHLD